MKKILSIISVFAFFCTILLYSTKLEYTSAAENYPFNGIIHADALGVHKTPDYKSNSEVTQLVYGAKVTVVGESGSLYKIVYDTDKEGYASKNYITNIASNSATSNIPNIETYEEYCKKLEEQGFPTSYCPQLYYLHSKYPKWIFKPDQVPYTLEESAKKEEEKVSLQTTNTNYHLIENGKSLVNEYVKNGIPYYYINAGTIVSFLDPRNSLFENTIFQFLNLEKNTQDVNDKAFASISSKGNLSKFYNEFKSAAQAVEINPLHLMTRSKQEGADRVGYSATSGKYTTTTGLKNPDGRTLDGFYNFYNIGSHVDKNNGYTDTIQRGLAYAAGYIEDGIYNKPWDTPEKAIIGGGLFIGKGYIKKGQNTNYFQKFNTSSYSGYQLFTHQYMTNAYAPKSESETILNAYKAGDLLNTNFEFIIPVYKNMNDTSYEPIDKNGDSTLSSLKINNNLIAGFNKTRTEYTGVNLVTEKASFTITITPNSPLSKITSETLVFENNQATVNFTEGVAKINFKVTAENETSTEYNLEIKQILPVNDVKVNDIVSKLDTRINSDYMYGISPGTTMEGLINTVKKNKGSATITDSLGQTKKDNVLVTGDKITIEGTTEKKTYTISVRGDINGDGAVKINDLILLQSHILEKVKLTNEKMYAADINYDSNLKINDLILIQSYILGKASL